MKSKAFIMKRFSLIFTIFLFHQFVFSQTPQIPKLQEIRTNLQNKIKKKELASVAIAVIKNDKILWKETLGWADRERKIKATSKTIYPLASLSKSITSTGIWALAEKRKLNVNDSVRTHLKSAKLKHFQGKSNDLKIKHLLNMEGGIPHQFEYFYDKDNENKPTLKEQIKRYGFVAFPPGEVHNYSNFSMGILDQIIADVSGKSFESFMNTNVFKPLGMKNTFTQKPKSANLAKGYDPKGNPVLPSIFQPRGGAGFYSTLDDLIQYGFGHLKKKNFLKPETLDLAHRPNQNSPHSYYSSGWGVLPTSDGRTSLLSNGAIAGTATTIYLIPKDDLLVVCLTNTTVGNDFTDSLAFKISGVLLEGHSQSLQKLFEEVGSAFASKPFVTNETFIGKWKGKIKTNQGRFPIEMSFEKGGKIYVSFKNQKKELMKNPSIEKGLLIGTVKGTIPTKVAMRKPHQIKLKLMKKGDKLFGIATARSTSEPIKFYLPYYIELDKQ